MIKELTRVYSAAAEHFHASVDVTLRMVYFSRLFEQPHAYHQMTEEQLRTLHHDLGELLKLFDVDAGDIPTREGSE